ncbi:hypothetical protein [Acetobacter sp.]|uniref:hypothetical protein n=1 Tax=Acetobacter sp. TaxID=440 RepID=UPI0039E94D35
MSEAEFIDAILSVASEVKGASISSGEKERIVKEFNKSKKDDYYQRAKEAIENVIGTIPEDHMSLESLGSVNNLQNLLSQMAVAANAWGKDKN